MREARLADQPGGNGPINDPQVRRNPMVFPPKSPRRDEAGAFYIMDRGFTNFERLHRFHLAGCFFIIRAKSNLKVQRRYSQPVNRATGLISDQTLVFRLLRSQGLCNPITTYPLQGSGYQQNSDLPYQQLLTPGIDYYGVVPLSLANQMIMKYYVKPAPMQLI